MKKLYTVLFVVAMSLFVSCDREISDGISNEMAIKMSVSVDKTKAILTTDNIIGTSIGVFGYKEQISNQNNKYLVFNNEKLSFESDSWAYSPVRYWDTQTAYSFIAYAPYQENSDDVLVNDFESITINGIPQWQDADAIESKDYVVALTDSAATNYINNGGVDLKFHHILANLKITAFKEGDSDFEIQNITIGADIDNQRVPAVDAERSYVQNFGHERADGSFSNVTLIGIPISLFAGNMAVEQAANVVANLLVAPFTAGADLPLTITYTENGAEKSAVVNSGITEFKSDAVYTVNLKFTSTVADEPAGPSGPGIEVVPGFSYAISDGGRNNILAFSYNNGNPVLKTSYAEHPDNILWQSTGDLLGDDLQQLCIELKMDAVTTIKYYLAFDENGNVKLTDDVNSAFGFKNVAPNNPGMSIGCFDANGNYRGRLKYIESERSFKVISEQYVGQDSWIWPAVNVADCKVVDGYAGPLIYVNNNSSFTEGKYNVGAKQLSVGGRVNFDVIASAKTFQYYYDGNMSRFFFDGCKSMYEYPTDQVYTNWIWNLEGADGYATIDNDGTLVYNNQSPNDILVKISATAIIVVSYNPYTTKSITGYYEVLLKGSSN